jgi:predicted acylesterase/phospholipase RssA
MSAEEAAGLKKCDIVMKGGITSGIVYPGLICKLAEHYQFQSIGGTSAGAIAAALTAAAEYARKKDHGLGQDAFTKVGEVPGWLGDSSKVAPGSNLFNLFQPQPEMKVLFKLATAFLVQGWARRILLCGKALWLEILLGLIPLSALFYVVSTGNHWRFALSILLGAFVGIAGIATAVILGILVRATRLSSHHYGFCTGYTVEKKGCPLSLIGWLNERVNTVSGMESGHPLTFGDLKNSGITLKMITTCLTFGRPFTLPFDSAEFYYSPKEMRRFFPAEVVAWMENHPAQLSGGGEAIDSTNLKPLPDHDHLPVIVAARLSLSFPVLFCAIPLYAVDWTRRRRTEEEGAATQRVPGDALDPKELRTPECVWFSDGGICSNFPMHLFDSPFPEWPTFGIDLLDKRPDFPETKVWMPKSNGGGISHLWTRLTTMSGIGGAGSFVFAMFNAARNWLDNLQATVPGYRDRIVHIYLNKREGGLNLNMPREVVTDLGKYGELAALKLIEHFVYGMDGNQKTPMTWDNHRWIRYRSTMAVLESFLAGFADSVEHPEAGDSTVFDLINRVEGAPPTSYELKGDQHDHAVQMTNRLRELGHDGDIMVEGAPKPSPALRIRPSF